MSRPDYLLGLLSWFNRLFSPRSKPWRVRIEGDRIFVVEPNGVETSIHLVDLRAVEIITTDDGPWTKDCWWRLFGAHAGAPLIYPNMAEGTDLVVRRMIDLPGFDHLGMMAAMSSTENALFSVWGSVPVEDIALMSR